MTAPVDIDALQQWVGRSESAEDEITIQQVRAFTATLAGDLSVPKKGDPAPLAFHWCLAPRLSTLADADVDGHPKRGDFLPPVPLPRRMWAGGELELLAPLRVGDIVKRQSRIEDIAFKTGRSGPLCFVKVAHEFTVQGSISIRERHDIVYRDQARGETPKPVEAVTKIFAAGQVIDPSSILLFRYSALTFNSHRIHYDVDYAVGEEGYAGLVVHGPLQAPPASRGCRCRPPTPAVRLSRHRPSHEPPTAPDSIDTPQGWRNGMLDGLGNGAGRHDGSGLLVKPSRRFIADHKNQ